MFLQSLVRQIWLNVVISYDYTNMLKDHPQISYISVDQRWRIPLIYLYIVRKAKADSNSWHAGDWQIGTFLYCNDLNPCIES
jgi:hypothetical protein